MGTYLSNKSCYPCISNCSSCSMNNSCNNCSSGYELAAENSVQSCQSSSSSSFNIYILIPIGSGIISGLLVFGLIYYWFRIRNREEPIPDGMQSEQRIVPGDLNWEHYEPIDSWQKEVCPICLDEVLEVETDCKHLFHLKCVLVWCLSKKTCPFCRRIVRELKFICSHCKSSYVKVNIGQARQLKDNRCRECESVKRRSANPLIYQV